ncbi:hypothetical protein OROMI_032187 [Orobanche minor]
METMRANQVRFPMARSGFNEGGRRISVLANYFQVTVAPPAEGCFYVYTVTIKLADGFPVGAEAMRRRILDNLDLGGTGNSPTRAFRAITLPDCHAYFLFIKRGN